VHAPASTDGEEKEFMIALGLGVKVVSMMLSDPLHPADPLVKNRPQSFLPDLAQKIVYGLKKFFRFTEVVISERPLQVAE
jgi:hypothetical protein